MNHLLCFGFGFSAQHLARLLGKTQWKITGTSRTDEGVSAMAVHGIHAIRFDALSAIPMDVTHVLSSVPPGVNGDPVLAAYGVALCLQAAQFKWVAYLSTTGVYGDRAGAVVDETAELTPNTDRGQRRVDAEVAWQAVPHLPLHIFRLPGIYGPGRNQLESVREGSARRVIKLGQIFSRIHVDDIAGILAASIAHPNPGRIYNVADDEPCPPQDVVTYAAALLRMKPPPEIAFEQAELSAMARSFYADSKSVSNMRVKQELAYRLKYPNYRVGLQSLL